MNIQDFLKIHPMKGLAYSLYRKRGSKAIANRIVALSGLIKGRFSFRETFLLFLPTRFKSESLRGKFLKFLSDKMSEEVKGHIRKFINDDGSVDVFGHRFHAASNNYGELMEFLSEVIVHDQYSANIYLKDGDVVIDAGANIGSFSVLCSNVKSNVTVYAFEPVSTTFEVLEENTRPYHDVHCVNKGLGDNIQKRKIYFSLDSTAGSTFNICEADSSKYLSEEVETETIDNFVEKNSIQKVDLIKMDTEGFESEILKGARETIKRFGPMIAVSAYHKPDDITTLPQLIRDINHLYEFKLLDSREADLIFYIKK